MVLDFIYSISTAIDYVGQRRAEKVFQIIISVFAIVGFLWGFQVQRFSETLMILAVGVGLSCLIVLPPWPFWRRNPLKWQKPVKKDTAKTN